MDWTDALQYAIPGYGLVKAGTDLVNSFGQTNDQNKQLHDLLTQQSGQAGGFGQQLQQGLGGINNNLSGQVDYLKGLQSGQNSLVGQQLGQSLQQQLAQQQSAAAGANPQNAAMASRNAMRNMAQASYGTSGQAALAGIAERNQAAQQLNNLLLQQRGQNISGANSAYGTAVGGYGAGVGNPYQNWAQQYAPLLGMASSGIGAAAGASDERLKKDAVAEEDDDKKSRQILQNLKPYSYKYKDERLGKGEQYGVMAQDLEKAGLGHAVMDTPYGKMVHAGKAATSALALSAALAKRLEALETDREGKGKRSAESDEK